MFVSRYCLIGYSILLNFNVLCQEQRLDLVIAFPADEEDVPYKHNNQVNCCKVFWVSTYCEIVRIENRLKMWVKCCTEHCTLIKVMRIDRWRLNECRWILLVETLLKYPWINKFNFILNKLNQISVCGISCDSFHLVCIITNAPMKVLLFV